MTKMYHPRQLLNNGALSLSGVCIFYLRLVRNQPVSTIIIPRTRPIKIPIFTLLIKIPTTNPITIAKINAISPLRMLGFRSAAMFLFFDFTSKGLSQNGMFSRKGATTQRIADFSNFAS